MKIQAIFPLVLAALFPCATFSGAAAQEPIAVNFSNAAGEIYAVTPRQLRLVDANVMSIAENGQDFIAVGLVGALDFTTPPFASGSVAAGGTFNTGGEFSISSPFDADVTARFAAGTWTRHVLADGTSNYVLTAQIAGTMFFAGTEYSIHGVTMQISLNTIGQFTGINDSSGGSTAASAVAN